MDQKSQSSSPDPEHGVDLRGRYRALFEATPDGIMIVDDRGRYVEVNDSLCRMLRAPRERLTGAHFSEFIPPERLDEAIKSFSALQQGEHVVSMEFPLRAADGTMIELEWSSRAGFVPGLHFCVARDIGARKRAEAACRLSEARLARAQRITGLGVWEVDYGTGSVYWSEEMYRIFGVEPGRFEPSMEAFFAAVPEEDRPLIRDAAERAVRGEAAYDLVHRIVRADGAVRYVSEHAEVVFDAPGGYPHFHGTLHDVTDRRQVEQELHRSEERYRRFIEQSSEGIYRFEVERPIDPGLPEDEMIGEFYRSAYLAECNDALARMYGYASASELVGARLADYLPPSDPHNVEYLRSFIRSGFRLTDAESHEVDREGLPKFFLNNLVGILEGGRLVRAWGTQRDVTDRKRAEDELRVSERRFALFMQHLPGLAWIKDVEGRYLFANDAATKAFGMPRQKLYGRTDSETFPPETASLFQQNDRVALDSGGMQTVETLEQEDGVHHSIVSKFPILGPDDRAVMIGGVAIDISERLRAEEALRDADRRKDEFLAMLAHELRNPLSSIGNAVQLLERPESDAEQLEWSKQVIARQVKHLTSLIDDLLDVSRITRGKVELKIGPVDAAAAVANALESVRPLIDARGHQLEVGLGSNLRLEADPTRLEQVLVNLLSNAAKYTPPGGTIRIEARREEKEIVFRVRDDGIGIRPETLPRMFELFAQGDRTLARSEGGLGIGLTLVRSLAELHGGTVVASSDGPGKGSEFTVRLPAGEVPAFEVRHEVAPLKPAASAARILVVDDSVDNARGLARLLKVLGHRVGVEHGGPEAIAAAIAERPDFILLDIGLPGMDGYQVAARLRREESLRGVVIIAISGYGQDEDRRRSREAGIDHHLVKPIDHDALITLLAREPC